MKTINREICQTQDVSVMDRKETVKNLIILIGLILLFLTVFEYSVSTFSIPIDSALRFGIQAFFLVAIMIFLLLLVIYLEVRDR
jgi:polyferredoxin